MGGYPVRVTLPGGGPPESGAHRAGRVATTALDAALDVAVPGRMLLRSIPTAVRAAAPTVNQFVGGMLGMEGPLVGSAAAGTPQPAAVGPRVLMQGDPPINPPQAMLDKQVDPALAGLARLARSKKPVSVGMLRALAGAVPALSGGKADPKDAVYRYGMERAEELRQQQLGIEEQQAAAGDPRAAQATWSKAQEDALRHQALLLGTASLMDMKIAAPQKED